MPAQAKKKRGAAKLEIFFGVKKWRKWLERQRILGEGDASAGSLRHPAGEVAGQMKVMNFDERPLEPAVRIVARRVAGASKSGRAWVGA
jgi:hypothetical protein